VMDSVQDSCWILYMDACREANRNPEEKLIEIVQRIPQIPTHIQTLNFQLPSRSRPGPETPGDISSSVEAAPIGRNQPPRACGRNKHVPILPVCLAPPTTQGSPCIGKHGTFTIPPRRQRRPASSVSWRRANLWLGWGTFGVVGVRNCTITVAGFAD